MSLVSVIITTKNAAPTLPKLIRSVKRQSHKSVELVVVDNYSDDGTVALARRATPLVYEKGPERSVQRNFGAKKARGAYYLFLDADMVLAPGVVAECVACIRSNPEIRAVVVPERSVGHGFWAACKALERACYEGDTTIEAARFFEKRAFWEFGGYEQTLTGPEDWDLPLRLRRKYDIGRISSYITHDDGRLTLAGLAKKKFYYGKHGSSYLGRHPAPVLLQHALYVLRPSFYRHWRLLLRRLHVTAGLMVMLVVEQMAGLAGFVAGRLS